MVRQPTNAFRLCFQIVLIAGSIDNNAPGFIRESCAVALFADRVVDDILFFAAYRGRSGEAGPLYLRRSKWKTREKIWTGRCSKGIGVARGLSVQASITSRRCNQRRVIFIFRNRSAKADRPTGINSIGQVLQFPRKRDNAGRDASLQRGVIVVPSKWTVYRWIGRLPLKAPSRYSYAVCAYAQGRNSSLYLTPSNSSALMLSA